MRLHRVTLRNYRGVTETTVRFPDTGVTIVEGDNEVGKTSLAEAIDLLLTTPDSSTARRVRDVQPVGLDVGAEVEVELTVGDHHLVYAKRWHRQRSTTLEVLAPRREQLTGKEAHDRACRILADTLDEGLWRALQLTQGTELTQAGFQVPALGAALDLAAGGHRGGDREGDLWERITAEYERYWTPTGLPRAERTNLAAAIERASEELGLATAELADLEAAAEDVERLTAATVRLEGQRIANERSVTDLVAQADRVAERRREVRQLTTQLEAHRSEHDRVAQLWERRLELIAEVQQRAEEVAKRQAEVARTEPFRLAAKQRADDAGARATEAGRALVAAEAALRRAVADQDHRRQEIELAQLTERRDRVVAAQRRLDDAERTLDDAQVDSEVVERMEQAHLEAATARAAASAAAARIELHLERQLDVTVDGTAVTLDPGAPHDLTVGAQLDLTIPGVGRLVVHPGDDARALATRVADAERQLRERCRDAGVEDLAEAREVAARRAVAVRTAEEARATIARDLRDLTLESLSSKIERLGERTTRYRAERPAEPPLPPDLDAAQLITAEATRVAERLRVDAACAEHEAEEATAALQQAEIDDAGLTAVAQQAVAAAEQTRRSLDAARAEQSDEAIRGELEAARAVRDAAAAALSRAQAELDATDPETVDLLLDNARATAQRIDQELRQTEERRHELRVLLEVKGEHGLAQRVDEATTRLEHLRREHAQLEARAAAAKLLRDTIAAHRDAARRRYVAPFRERIEQLGRIVFGPTLEVELDDDLRIARRTLDGTTLDFEQLSVGAREQLGILSRLACATIVSEHGGAPVIFDDALGWTDPGRLERMGAAIAVAGRSCQVIILTCTPGRYAAVGGATVVELRR